MGEEGEGRLDDVKDCLQLLINLWSTRISQHHDIDIFRLLLLLLLLKIFLGYYW